MSYPNALTEAALNELFTQVQDQALIHAVEALWRATQNVDTTAQGAVAGRNPTLEMLATALRAVTAGTCSVTVAALGSAMYKANPSWGLDTCNYAAANVFKSFPGLYPRRFFGDMSAQPAVPNDGILSSPDIVVTGTSQLPSAKELLTNWNIDPSAHPAGNKANFAYVRGMNLFPGVEEGRVYLYYAQGNVTNNPAQWKQLNTVQGLPYASIQASNTGNLWFTDQAFTWTPPANTHLCLIACIETAHYPNPLPGGGIDPSQWVSNSPAIAWRNHDTLAGLNGVRSYTLEYGNTDSRTGQFVIAALARQMPPGVSVRLQSEVGEVNFDTGTSVISKLRQEVTASVELPAGFWGTLTVTIDNPTGIELPEGSFIDVRCYRKVEHEESPFALRALTHGIRPQLDLLADDPYLALVGSYSFVGK